MKNDFETRRYYTEGSAARQMQPMPDYREERKRREEREREAEQKRQKRIARQKQERALRTSKRYVIFLTAGVLVFGLFAGLYITIQSEVTARMRNISELESTLSKLKAENDEAYKRLSTAVDLDAIKQTAINEFGMFYATEEQIIYYTVENDDYMNQYIQIPAK